MVDVFSAQISQLLGNGDDAWCGRRIPLGKISVAAEAQRLSAIAQVGEVLAVSPPEHLDAVKRGVCGYGALRDGQT